MNDLRQIIRKPARYILGVFMLVLAIIMLCVSVGQFASALQLRHDVEGIYTTVALTTDKYMRETYIDEEGNTINRYYHQQPMHVQKFLDELPAIMPDVVFSVDTLSHASGYCPEIVPMYPAKEYVGSNADEILPPADKGIFAVTINEIGEPWSNTIEICNEDGVWFSEDNGSVVVLEGVVDKVHAIQKGYPDCAGRKITITLYYQSDEFYESLDIRVGGQYLINYGSFVDEDWSLRKELAEQISTDRPITPEEIDWKNISDIPPHIGIDDYNARRAELDLSPAAKMYTHVFADGTEATRTAFLHENEIQNVNRISVVIDTDAKRYYNSLTDGISEDEYSQKYYAPGIAKLTDDAQTLLDSEEWLKVIEQNNVNYHAFSFLGTDQVESIAQFAREDAIITEGRSFEPEEYSSGSNVCLISESLAVYNGLSVGDTLDVSFYMRDKSYPSDIGLTAYAIVPAQYSLVNSANDVDRTYTIVGLYRQNNEWHESEYSFFPNTILIPKSSMPIEGESSGSSVFQTYVLKNGTQDEMEAALADAGYEGLFTYYDQGYARIVDNLGKYGAISENVLYIGLAVFAVITLIFIIFFPLTMRQSVHRMWTLGARKSERYRHIYVSTLAYIVPAVVISGVVCMVFGSSFLKMITAAYNPDLTLTLTAPVVIGLCAGAALLLLILTGIAAIIITGEKAERGR